MTSIEKGLRFLQQLRREPLLAAWGLYIVLLPIRLVPSGYPQPVDALAIILFAAAMRGWNRRMPPNHRVVSQALTWFTVWVCVINVAWCAIEWEWGVNMLTPIYYIFNTIIVALVLVLNQRFGERFLRVTLYSLFAVTLFQVVASFTIHFGKTRASLFFNNSNQLGYYSLLTACVIAVTSRRLGFGLLKSSAGITACAYLALLSASRAALIGIGVLFIVLLVTNPRVIIIAGLAAIALAMSGGTVSQAIDESQRRLTEDRNPDQGFLEDRGYDRILNNKEYLLIGAGEGHAARFAEEGDAKLAGLEIHSSAGTIIFCYGIVGTLMIIRFLWYVARGAEWRLGVMLVPVLLYSLAHQGLRFSLLWVLLAVFVIVKRTPKPTNQTSTSLMTSPSRM